jgi:predicted nucleic acid-binding protein
LTYVDTSVVLAHVLAEDRRPPDSLWDEVLLSSQLTRYETWVRLNALGLATTHEESATAALGRLRLVSLSEPVIARALHPFPAPVRTLDALHLATLVFLSQLGDVRLASYDARMTAAARAMDIELYALTTSG